MIKITVENLGVLKTAKFDVSDFTIICGENNTGKTYATYALFGFLFMQEKLLTQCIVKKIHNGDRTLIDKIFNDGAATIELTEWLNKKGSILQSLNARYIHRLHEVFSLPASFFQNTKFDIDIQDDEMESKVLSKEYSQKIISFKKEFLSFNKNKNETKLEISLLVKQERYFLRHKLYELIADTINEIIFQDYFPRAFIASAERTGAAIFRNDLNFARNHLLEQINQADKNDSFERLIKQRRDYPLPVKCNVEFVRELSSLSKEESFLATEHPDILTDFENIIGGKYKAISREQNLVFVPNKTSTRLPMEGSSSAVRSMLDIGFFLKHTIKPGDILMIDEPELNLHPENQRRIARLLARLVNLGIKVFITTHSDYIVKELSTLIMLKQDKSYLQQIMDQENYKQCELLNTNKIKLYIAEKKLMKINANQRRKRVHTLVLANINQEQGIEARSFDKTIDKMNEIHNGILWGE